MFQQQSFFEEFLVFEYSQCLNSFDSSTSNCFHDIKSAADRVFIFNAFEFCKF